jgi:hypothetical protein
MTDPQNAAKLSALLMAIVNIPNQQQVGQPVDGTCSLLVPNGILLKRPLSCILLSVAYLTRRIHQTGTYTNTTNYSQKKRSMTAP